MSSRQPMGKLILHKPQRKANTLAQTNPSPHLSHTWCKTKLSTCRFTSTLLFLFASYFDAPQPTETRVAQDLVYAAKSSFKNQNSQIFEIEIRVSFRLRVKYGAFSFVISSYAKVLKSRQWNPAQEMRGGLRGPMAARHWIHEIWK